MNTPREILLERHRITVPKLDSIRRAVIGEGRQIAVPKIRAAGPATILRLIWRELIWPCRRIWAGLAAVWILILAANVSMRAGSQMTVAKVSPTPEMIQTWWQQERLLAELIGQSEPLAATPPKTFSPRPSGERRFAILTA